MRNAIATCRSLRDFVPRAGAEVLLRPRVRHATSRACPIRTSDPTKTNYKGVCHKALPEEGHVRPGEILLGTDSHTCTAGAFGQFATGIGNTDAAFVLGTGKTWLKVPPTMKFTFHGEIPPYLTAKDLILSRHRRRSASMGRPTAACISPATESAR